MYHTVGRFYINRKELTYDEIGNLTSYDGTTYSWNMGRQFAGVENGKSIQYAYDHTGMCVKKIVDGVTSTYHMAGTLITGETTNGATIWYNYDTQSRLISMVYNHVDYFYLRNAQGDIIALIDKAGNKVVEYKYDSWGAIVDVSGSMAGSLGKKNPFRYRGYYYDEETGLYYVSSRYYDAESGCWISPEPNMYAGVFDSGSGLMGYNIYAYCANNPVNFSDPTGEFILTALIVGAVGGAVVGGAMGGIVAYNSAKSSGLEGSDLFWATASGVGKEALIGGVAGGLIGATGGIVAAYGVTSVAGTAMITGTATITAKTTEVTALQAKKSANDGDNGWQIANDCIDSVFSNGERILSPVLTKTATTSASYASAALIKHKGVPFGFDTFLHSATKGTLAYGFVGYAWGQTSYAILCDYPSIRANERGYSLR